MSIQAIVWIFQSKRKWEISHFADLFEQFSLFISCIVLVWGLCKLTILANKNYDMIANKVMIALHVVSDLFVILVNALQYVP